MAGKGPQKTATKTGKPSPRSGYALPVGAHPGNTGGKKGRSGRKPGPFKEMLARLRESPALAKSLRKAIKDYDCRAFPAALKLLSDYDDAKPAKKLELTAPMSTAERQEAVRRLMQKVGQ